MNLLGARRIHYRTDGIVTHAIVRAPRRVQTAGHPRRAPFGIAHVDSLRPERLPLSPLRSEARTRTSAPVKGGASPRAGY